ncbi:S-adenosyl-L-methionine-dependent methyltransferase [Trichoderma camerunense]
MVENIYDSSWTFFENYTKLDRSTKGLDVLDLGCGLGFFCRWARDNGAASVLGVDRSKNMLKAARRMTGSHNERLCVPEQAYDLVFSALALHYVANLDVLLSQVWKSLRPGGRFVFSCEHPIATAQTITLTRTASNTPWRGFMVDEETKRKFWPLNDYGLEGLRVSNWLVDGVQKYHRTMASYITALLRAGFRLTDFAEWGPSGAQMKERPDFETAIVRPKFLVIGVQKSNSANYDGGPEIPETPKD